MTVAPGVFEAHRQAAGITHGELFLRYFALGGMSDALRLEAICYGALVPTDHDHDVIAHTLNQRFTEQGRNHPVPYAEDQEPPGQERSAQPSS